MDIIYDETPVGADMIGTFRKAAEICVEKEGMCPDAMEISLSFVSEDEIHELNRTYRNVDRCTDVLSFPMIEDFSEIDDKDPDGVIMLGDVVICVQQAEKQAEEYGHSRERELVYLFVHSVCHLLGYDHMTDEDKKEMRTREEEVMSALDLERGE